MTTQTATAENYNFSNLKTEQNLDRYIRFLYGTAIVSSTLLGLFPEQHSTQRILPTSSQIKETDNLSKIWEVTNPDLYDEFTRPTTPREQLIGEIRSWGLLETDWDGEGAAAPILRRIKDAVSFIRLLPESIPLPEPMLHASGNTGLFWEDDRFYADIEFLDDSRIAYYIEQNGDKHKGVINFDSKNLSPVLSVLLGR